MPPPCTAAIKTALFVCFFFFPPSFFRFVFYVFFFFVYHRVSMCPAALQGSNVERQELCASTASVFALVFRFLCFSFFLPAAHVSRRTARQQRRKTGAVQLQRLCLCSLFSSFFLFPFHRLSMCPAALHGSNVERQGLCASSARAFACNFTLYRCNLLYLTRSMCTY